MKKKYSDSPSDHIEPFFINGLEGRVLKAKSKTKKSAQILLVGDLLDSIEQNWPLINDLRRYGNVSCYDLPGIGGMTDFGKIDHDISVNSYADYLASLIKLRYKKHKVILVGKGFGFVIITRMLMRYPLLAKKIITVVCINGEIHHDDLLLSIGDKKSLRMIFLIMSWQPFSFICRNLLKNKKLFSYLYNNSNLQLRNLVFRSQYALNHKALMDLLENNNFTTHFRLLHELLTLDNCISRIDVPLKRAYLKSDLINIDTQKQHMQVTYKNYRQYEIKQPKNPIVDVGEQSDLVLPSGLKRVLSNAKA